MMLMMMMVRSVYISRILELSGEDKNLCMLLNPNCPLFLFERMLFSYNTINLYIAKVTCAQ